jgi:hypothetical protein
MSLEINVLDELRRRIERVEQGQLEVQTLFREANIAQIKTGEVISDMREDIRDITQDAKHWRVMELEVTKLKLGFNAAKWLISTVLGTAVLVMVNWLFGLV